MNGDIKGHEAPASARADHLAVDAGGRAQNAALAIDSKQQPIADARSRQKPKPQLVQRRRPILPVQLVVTWYVADKRFRRKFLDHEVLEHERLVDRSRAAAAVTSGGNHVTKQSIQQHMNHTKLHAE